MRSYNFEPFWRSTIGFDRLFDLAEAAAQHAAKTTIHPITSNGLAKITIRSRSLLPVFHPTKSR